MPRRAACRAAARAPCSRSRARRSGTSRGWPPGMRRSLAAMRDAGRRSIRATAIGRFGSSWRAGACDERRPDVSALAPGGTAGAEAPAASARGDRPAAARCRRRRESRVGVRLRVRHVRRRADAEVPDGRRRIHARMPGDRCGRQHPVRPRHRGARRSSSACTARRAICGRTTARSSSRARSCGGSRRRRSRRRFIDPGKPWQNGTDESFNGKFRDEFLTLQWFRNRVDAKVGIEQWRRHYNEVRPHSSLGVLDAAEFKATASHDDGGARRRCRLALTRKNERETD